MILRWQVYAADLDPVSGSEQAGRRPVLVVSCDAANRALPVVSVIPLTSRKSETDVVYPNEVLIPAGIGGTRVDSLALAYQIRALDKRRLARLLGAIEDDRVQAQIMQALRYQLELT